MRPDNFDLLRLAFVAIFCGALMLLSKGPEFRSRSSEYQNTERVSQQRIQNAPESIILRDSRGDGVTRCEAYQGILVCSVLVPDGMGK